MYHMSDPILCVYIYRYDINARCSRIQICDIYRNVCSLKKRDTYTTLLCIYI